MYVSTSILLPLHLPQQMMPWTSLKPFNILRLLKAKIPILSSIGEPEARASREREETLASVAEARPLLPSIPQ